MLCDWLKWSFGWYKIVFTVFINDWTTSRFSVVVFLAEMSKSMSAARLIVSIDVSFIGVLFIRSVIAFVTLTSWLSFSLLTLFYATLKVV